MAQQRTNKSNVRSEKSMSTPKQLPPQSAFRYFTNEKETPIMKTNSLATYRNCTRRIKVFLKIAGIWPDSHPATRYLLSRFILFIVGATLLGVSNFCLQHASSIPVVTRHIGGVVSFSATFLKMCIFISRQADIKFLNDTLSATFDNDLRSPQHRSLALRQFWRFASLSNAIMASVPAISLISIVMPLLALRHNEYAVVMSTAYPFDYEPGGFVYWAIQTITVLAVMSTSVVACGIDSLFGLYTLQICGQFDALAGKFEKLRAEDSCELRDGVKRYVSLVKSRDRIERIFGWISIWTALTTALVQCTLVFQAVQVIKTTNLLDSCFVCVFFALKLAQAFIYAWCGSLITEASEKCLNSIYSSDWPACRDRRFCKNVLFVLTQKPVVFKAKGCMLVQMDMLSMIVQTSMSYFFLLRTLNQDS